jgi:hypothetical protein
MRLISYRGDFHQSIFAVLRAGGPGAGSGAILRPNPPTFPPRRDLGSRACPVLLDSPCEGTKNATTPTDPRPRAPTHARTHRDDDDDDDGGDGDGDDHRGRA